MLLELGARPWLGGNPFRFQVHSPEVSRDATCCQHDDEENHAQSAKGTDERARHGLSPYRLIVDISLTSKQKAQTSRRSLACPPVCIKPVRPRSWNLGLSPHNMSGIATALFPLGIFVLRWAIAHKL